MYHHLKGSALELVLGMVMFVSVLALLLQGYSLIHQGVEEGLEAVEYYSRVARYCMDKSDVDTCVNTYIPL